MDNLSFPGKRSSGTNSFESAFSQRRSWPRSFAKEFGLPFSNGDNPMLVAMACGSYFWLRTGDEAFAMMLNAIDEAMSDVRLEMYIFSAGQIGEHFRTALERA
ncbi:MAG TPA: hypothetical protein PLW35_13105, partial [Verrucomicrobiota bacterium]|nr:hypothetical protein [Verrucomicrobiota bacterium]